MERIQLLRGDITEIKADAIVNAANSSLLGGGGVDGAIHRAAGPQLLAECRKLNGCETGQAKMTKGYDLPAKFVIHTVGPIWSGGENNEARLLGSCYSSSLSLALSHGLKSIVFPNISTGVYGYPKNEAARIAIDTVKSWLYEHPEILTVYFIVFDEENFNIYHEILQGR